MAISAYLETVAKRGGKSRGTRHTIRLQVQGSDAEGGEIGVLIHNISATGLLIESDVTLEIGEKIAIGLPHSGASSAKVVWASDHLYGCRFTSAISTATLSAAQLRGIALTDGPKTADTRVAADESLGARLLRLRGAKGLTQAQVADHLGVSEPSISAWEQDKSRPKAGRIEALAALFGVKIAELMGHEPTEKLENVVLRARASIAEAAGIAPESVRITIEI